MLILVWVIAAILAFNLLFVAVRVWATRPSQVRAPRSHGFTPVYATIVGKQYPHGARRRTDVRRHPGRH